MKNNILTSLTTLLCFSSQIYAVETVLTQGYQQNYNTVQAPAGGKAVRDINTNGFQQTLANTSKPVVLIFSAVWCKPCQSMKPILEEIAREMPEVTFLRVDFDASPELVQSYGIDSIPAILFIRPDGYVVDRSIGFSQKQQLKGRIQAFAASLRQQ